MLTTKCKRERKRRGLSLLILGAQTGIQPTELSRIERGKAVPYPAHRKRLAHALGIPEADLQRRVRADE